jgi:hypothetical protein
MRNALYLVLLLAVAVTSIAGEVVIFGGCALHPPAEETTPDTLDFGLVAIGETAVDSFKIKNVGEDPCSTLTGTVTIPDCPGYSIVSGAGPYSLERGEEWPVVVQYAPLLGCTGADSCVVETGGE